MLAGEDSTLQDDVTSLLRALATEHKKLLPSTVSEQRTNLENQEGGECREREREERAALGKKHLVRETERIRESG